MKTYSRWEKLFLAVGDVIAFLLFAILGLTHHGLPITAERVVGAALPFLIPWFLIAPSLGVFDSPVTHEPKRALWLVPSVWLLCGLVGSLGRSLFLHRPFVPSFVAVALIVHALLLTLWRTAYAAWSRRQRVPGDETPHPFGREGFRWRSGDSGQKCH